MHLVGFHYKNIRNKFWTRLLFTEKKKSFLNPLVIVKSKECYTAVHDGFNCQSIFYNRITVSGWGAVAWTQCYLNCQCVRRRKNHTKPNNNIITNREVLLTSQSLFRNIMCSCNLLLRAYKPPFCSNCLCINFSLFL